MSASRAVVAQPALDDLIWQTVDDYVTAHAGRNPRDIDLGTFAMMAVAREMMIARKARLDEALTQITHHEIKAAKGE
jgi:hypothetical protein